jgi:hypothetical protein
MFFCVSYRWLNPQREMADHKGKNEIAWIMLREFKSIFLLLKSSEDEKFNKNQMAIFIKLSE